MPRRPKCSSPTATATATTTDWGLIELVHQSHQPHQMQQKKCSVVKCLDARNSGAGKYTTWLCPRSRLTTITYFKNTWNSEMGTAASAQPKPGERKAGWMAFEFLHSGIQWVNHTTNYISIRLLRTQKQLNDNAWQVQPWSHNGNAMMPQLSHSNNAIETLTH